MISLWINTNARVWWAILVKFNWESICKNRAPYPIQLAPIITWSHISRYDIRHSNTKERAKRRGANKEFGIYSTKLIPPKGYSYRILGLGVLYARSCPRIIQEHNNDVIMSAIASQITTLRIVYSSVNSGADQRKHQSSASLAFVRGILRWSVNSPHKGPVTRTMFPFDDVIMKQSGHPLSTLFNNSCIRLCICSLIYSKSRPFSLLI